MKLLLLLLPTKALPMKLKYLLILVFITISGLPLLFGLQYFNNQAAFNSREQLKDHLSALSNIAEQRILTAVNRIKDNTSLIASRTQLRSSLSQWNQSRQQGDYKKIMQIISDAKKSLMHIHHIRIYDPKGSLVALVGGNSQVKKIDGEALSRSTVKLLMDGEDIIASKVKPLFIETEIVGYIEVGFYTDFISNLVKDRTGLGETGEWLLAIRDNNGDALFAVPLKYDSGAAFKLSIPSERIDIPITRALQGNEIIMSGAPDYRGESVLASTRYIPELDWGLVAKIDESEVNQQLIQNKQIIYIAGALIIMLAIVIGVILAFYIARPIEVLIHSTVKASRGVLEKPKNVNVSWSEAKALTEHFSYMIKSLKELNGNLQNKVDEKTRSLSEANKKLEELATRDSLTGLFNRRHFNIKFAEEFYRHKRYGHGLAVVILDIDHFKMINDQYGHPVGDKVLIKLGDYLRSATRDSDIAARIGGEEFCLLLCECAEDTLMNFLERLRADISSMEFSVENADFTITCSFGVTYQKGAVEKKDVLLKQADIALYQAKKAGRNRIVKFSEGYKSVTSINNRS